MSADDFDYPDLLGVAYAVVPLAPDVAYKSVIASHAPLRKQQAAASAFAPERHGNMVEAFTTGEDYFKNVCNAIQGATKSVFIAGWQVNWAVKLHGETRLIDALHGAVKNGAKVYVMPWQSPKAGVNTGDLGTMLAVFQLNAGRPKLQAFCCPAGMQNDMEGVEETFFSHHQKLVLVDGTAAFLGGIDLAFGRRDGVNFDLAHGWRTGPEVYNSGVPPEHKLLPAEATAYVDESELLKSTLSVGPLKHLFNAETSATNSGATSAAGGALDGAVGWWRKPVDWDQLPSWLRTPVKWSQEQAAAVVEPARRAVAQAEQKAADAFVRKLDAGLISASQVAAVIDAARTVVRSTYNALLSISWATEAPYAELMTPGSQSTPTGDATFRADQPRMPWQDVQVRIEGPSVYDLAQNFIRRWNSVQKSYLLGPLEARTRIGDELAPPKPAAGKGNGGTGGVAVRVLRSAPLQLQLDERAANPGMPPPVAAQREIHDAMVAAIRRAERFVYIENQFFQSGFGEPSIKPDEAASRSGPMSYLMSQPGNRIAAAITRGGAANAHVNPRNHIARALADRIEHAIRWGQPFHAYIVLPVHPEGSLADMAVVGQVHWTMQSLVFASDSLVNRVRLALFAKQNCKESRTLAEWEEAKRLGLAINADTKEPEFRSAIKLSATSEHLTLLNLRTCQTVAGQVRTEQVYVHTKLLIVDDRIVIVGSANINDRSLKGGRDSELAVLMMDTVTQTAPIDGKNPIHVRTLAHQMRVQLWKKHFALLGHSDLVQPASGLASMVDKPADPATWKAIQAFAGANALAYAKAFQWVPRDGASIWPVWDVNRKFSKKQQDDHDVAIEADVKPFVPQMPFSEGFWKKMPSFAAPAGVKGFFCALPMEWTLGENNHPGMNMALLTQLNLPGQSPGTAVAQVEPAANPNGRPA